MGPGPSRSERDAGRLEVLRRSERGYEEARHGSVANGRVPARFPAAIVRPRDRGEVAAAVRLARREGWTVDCRSGGHSWSGSHLHDGALLLDLSALTACEVDVETRTARAEPGLRTSALDALVAPAGLLFPTGHCIGPGLGGFLLQGGFGWDSRRLGPACMSVTAVEGVTAAGDPFRASAAENADLFWAARGAGPGFPAIATSFELRLHPRPAAVLVSAYHFGLDALEELMEWAHGVAAAVPASIELMVFLTREGPQLLAPVLAGSEEEALADLAPVEACPLLDRAVRRSARRPIDLGELVAETAVHYPEGRRYAVDNMWTSADAAALMPGYREIAATLPAVPSHMMWMNWSPRSGPQRPDMAYSVEDDVYIGLYGVWTDRAEDDRHAGWAGERIAAMDALSSGIQLADENLALRPRRYLGDAQAARLQEVRDRWDPDGLIHGYNTQASAAFG